jgi:type I restriction enzyme S subunit
MKDRYKRIGDYIEIVDERNSELKVDKLLGVSINKYFMPSVANIVGTDLSNYKIIKKYQFACSLMQVSRDEKIPIDCLTDYDIAIVSPAYAVFKVSDTKKLLPQYLSMWFKRSEFDREASFLGVGGIRGSMTWDDFCDMEFPLPSIERQKAVVNAYKTVADRIALKRKINKKQEEIAETYFQSIFGNPDELPNNWSYAQVGDFCQENITNLSNIDEFKAIKYLDTGNITKNYIENFQTFNISDDIPSRAKRKVFDGDIVYSTVRPNLQHYGLLKNPPNNMIVSTGFAVLHNRNKGISNELLYMWLTNKNILEYLQSLAENSVSTYPALNVSDLLNVKIIVPDTITLNKANVLLRSIFISIYYNNREIRKLSSSIDVLLPKLTNDKGVTNDTRSI